MICDDYFNGAFGANPKDLVNLWQIAINTSQFHPNKIIFAIKIDTYSNKWGTCDDIFKLFE